MGKRKSVAGKSIYLTRAELIEIEEALQYHGYDTDPELQAHVDSATRKIAKALGA